MERHTSALWSGLFALSILAVRSPAPPVNFTWSPSAASTGVFETNANWADGTAPLTANNADLIFGTWTTAPSTAVVYLANSIDLRSLVFTSSTPHYYFDHAPSFGPTIGISHGLTVGSGSNVDFSYGGPGINLTASQTWQIDGNLSVYPSISGAYSITKTGPGILALGGVNGSFTDLTVSAGSLYLADSSNTESGIHGPVGNGTLTLAGGTTLATLFNEDEIELHNNVNLTGNISIGQSGSSSFLELKGALNASSPGTTVTVTGGILVLHGTTGTNVGTFSLNSGAGVAFDGHQALPATSITAATGSYVGMAGDLSSGGSYSAATVIALLNPASFAGTLGFDDDETSSYGTIDLSGFTHADFAGLGTLNNGTIGGASGSTLIAPASGSHQGELQFSALFDTTLTVAAPLLTTNGVTRVTIGRHDELGDDGTVVLNYGSNNYTGGTDLVSGTLVLGASSAGDGSVGPLGTGTLVLRDGVTLAYDGTARTLRNAISLPTGTEATIPLPYGTQLSLLGQISGSGSLDLEGDSEHDEGGTLILSGDNSSWSGGLNIYDSPTIEVTHNHALGTGTLWFDSDVTYYAQPNVIFSSAAPVIRGLSGGGIDDSEGYDASFITLNTGTVLTIDQTITTEFIGSFEGAGSLVKAGAGTLTLGGISNFSGGLTLNAGTVVLDAESDYYEVLQSGPAGTGTITVNSGATLVTDSDTEIFNSVVLTSGARLAGHGYVDSATIVSGAILSPGSAQFGFTGSIDFAHLELDGGGIYEWHIQNPDAESSARDLVNVDAGERLAETLVINATAADRFTLKIVSLNLSGFKGTLAGVDLEHGLYTWTLFSYDSLETALANNIFDPDAFSLDASQFTTEYGTGAAAGSFEIFQQGTSIMLGFTPVPEPSTYALMALGLGFIGLTVWRKSRRVS